MRLSVLIPTKNRVRPLADTLVSLFAQTRLPDEIILVDQSADDSTRVRVTALWSACDARVRDAVALRYFHRPEFGGLPAARNFAMEQATGDVWWFLDDDVWLAADHAERLLELYAADAELTGCSGVITNYAPPSWRFRLWRRVFERGPFRDERQELYWRAHANRHNRNRNHAGPARVRFLGGGLMSFRAQALRGYRMEERPGCPRGEDVEFCLGLGPARLMITPRARLEHRHAPRPGNWRANEFEGKRWLYERFWHNRLRDRFWFAWLRCGHGLWMLADSGRRPGSFTRGCGIGRGMVEADSGRQSAITAAGPEFTTQDHTATTSAAPSASIAAVLNMPPRAPISNPRVRDDSAHGGMKILFLTLELSYPPTNGAGMRSWAVAQGFADCGHEIAVLGFHAGVAPPGRAPCRLLPPIPLEVRSLSSSRVLGPRLLAAARRRAFSANRFASPAMRAAIVAALRSEAFDAVVADSVFSAVNLLPDLRLPLIINTHNVEHLLLRRYAERERRTAQRLYAAWEWRRLCAWETGIWRRARLLLACSEIDAAAMARLAPEVECAVAPNVVDVATYIPRCTGDPQTLLYTGGLDWWPNRDAVEFFAADILPRLRRRYPHLRLAVAGRNGPEHWQRQFARRPGVACLGPAPDMRAVLDAAGICVVPLRIGSGTRLKILEAAAMAKPIVSTRLGAEGLELTHGRELLLADDPAEFAAAIETLLANADLRHRLGTAARAAVMRQYNRAALQHRLEEALHAPAVRLLHGRAPATHPKRPQPAAPPSPAVALTAKR